MGPVWQGGTKGEHKLLSICVKQTLKMAVQDKYKTIALPAISTGKYGFPVAQGTRVLVEAVQAFIQETYENTLTEIHLISNFDEAIIGFLKAMTEVYEHESGLLGDIVYLGTGERSLLLHNQVVLITKK